MANQANHYDAGNIQVLEGLEAVRMRPGMYIGTTSTRGLHHLLWEIVDNAIDEASNGFADEVRVTLHTDGLQVTGTTASGVAEVVYMDGAAAGDMCRVRF